MAPIKVGIVGASGETGTSIVNGLLASDQEFEIIALTRPSSMEKQANKNLSALGITHRPIELTASHSDLVIALSGIEILISTIVAWEVLSQIPLATAAKAAGVQRFIPCAFGPIVPAGGLHDLRDDKETVFNYVKQLGLPYTIIDVGWWYQLSVPILPSGKTDSWSLTGKSEIAGDGSKLSALTNLHDIGTYVARIVVDERTLNKYVLCYNEMWSQNQIWELFEKLSGEQIPRPCVSEAELRGRIASVADKGRAFEAVMVRVPAQYLISWGIRGDNTPEFAKYLGYLTTKELYPELQGKPFGQFAKEVLAGEAKEYYAELRKQFRAAA